MGIGASVSQEVVAGSFGYATGYSGAFMAPGAIAAAGFAVSGCDAGIRAGFR